MRCDSKDEKTSTKCMTYCHTGDGCNKSSHILVHQPRSKTYSIINSSVVLCNVPSSLMTNVYIFFFLQREIRGHFAVSCSTTAAQRIKRASLRPQSAPSVPKFNNIFLNLCRFQFLYSPSPIFIAFFYPFMHA